MAFFPLQVRKSFFKIKTKIFFLKKKKIAEIPENARRTLVLVSKILTNIANQQKSAGGQKEVYMEATDKFVEDNMQRVIDYFVDISVAPFPSSSEKQGEGEQKGEGLVGYDSMKIEMQKSQVISAYKKIATEMLNGGRDKLVGNLEKLKNEKTEESFLFSASFSFQIFQLYVPFLKLMAMEKARNFSEPSKTLLNFISLLFLKDMTLSFELVKSSIVTKQIDISTFSNAFLKVALSLSSSSSPFPLTLRSSFKNFSVYKFFEGILKKELSFFASKNLSNFCEQSFTSKFFVEVCLNYASPFLKNVLSSLVMQIIEENPLLEYDQKKLPPEMSASENILQLISITKNFVEKLLTSMFSFPFFLWKLLNILLQQFSLFLPQNDSAFQVPDVCQFLFSTLFCSALQKPKLFGLTETFSFFFFLLLSSSLSYLLFYYPLRYHIHYYISLLYFIILFIVLFIIFIII